MEELGGSQSRGSRTGDDGSVMALGWDRVESYRRVQRRLSPRVVIILPLASVVAEPFCAAAGVVGEGCAEYTGDEPTLESRL